MVATRLVLAEPIELFTENILGLLLPAETRGAVRSAEWRLTHDRGWLGSSLTATVFFSSYLSCLYWAFSSADLTL